MDMKEVFAVSLYPCVLLSLLLHHALSVSKAKNWNKHFDAPAMPLGVNQVMQSKGKVGRIRCSYRCAF